MLISKINFYNPLEKSFPTKQGKISFKGEIPEPKKCFELPSHELCLKYGGHKTILTQNQIIALKKCRIIMQNRG